LMALLEIRSRVGSPNNKPKLNITWDRDRGKDVESTPWFRGFKGDDLLPDLPPAYR
jgi:hypothetical protein